MSSTEKELHPDYSQSGWGDTHVKKKVKRQKVKRSLHRGEVIKVGLSGSRANGLVSNRVRSGSGAPVHLAGRFCKTTLVNRNSTGSLGFVELNTIDISIDKQIKRAGYVVEHDHMFEITTDKELLLSRAGSYEQARREGMVKIVVKGDERFKGFD